MEYIFHIGLITTDATTTITIMFIINSIVMGVYASVTQISTFDLNIVDPIFPSCSGFIFSENVTPLAVANFF